MNKRLLSVFTFALIVSGVASLLVYNFVLAHVAEASTKKLPKRRMLVAARDMNPGALVTDLDVRYVETTEAVPEGTVTEKAQAINRGVIAAIYTGEPLKISRLAATGAGAGLAAMIPVGKRAVAIRVDEVVGLAGFVVPGMRVDVIVSGGGNMGEQNRNGMLSRTVLQNIEVLSAGQKIEKHADGRPEQAEVVNLLVSPAQAETLSLASNESKIQLVLRNPLDTKEEKTAGTSVAAMFGQAVLSPASTRQQSAVIAATAPPAPKPKPEGSSVEVFAGGKRSEQTLDQE